MIRTLLFVGLSLSIGWGVRGNFGHEWGAALPGALAAMAAVLISGRDDWMRRIAWFGMLGAIGWALGGSMAYMVVIAYTHSGHSPSVLYGFYSLFIIGFLWAAVGGAAATLPALISREKLAQFCVPLVIIFLLWWGFELIANHFIENSHRFGGRDPLDWYDANWYSAALAIIAVLGRAAFRRRIDWAEKLILWMAIGWWIGFLVITVGLHLLMAPNKGEDWSGSVGMTAALLVYMYRTGLKPAVYCGLTIGVLGGMAFALAVLFKLAEVKLTGDYKTNWHSILEQSYGFMNGIALAIPFLTLTRTAPQAEDIPSVPRTYTAFAVAFLLLLLTYLNMYKEVHDWTSAPHNAMPGQLYFLSAGGWFDLFYALLALTFLALLRAHMRRLLSLIPTSPLGKAQMLYLALAWWMIAANFMRALVNFEPQRLVTEGTIFVNGLICTLMALLWCSESRTPAVAEPPDYGLALRRIVAFGAVAFVLCPILCWGAVRVMYGDTFAGEAGRHYRFGPNAKPAGE